MKQEKHFIVDILFVLALFAVFAVSSLMLVTVGSEVYRHIVEDMSSNYEARTSLSYITEKIRQNDSLLSDTGTLVEGPITLTTLDGLPALQLLQEIDGGTYATYLYLYEGHLKELFMRTDGYLGRDMAAAGQDIMPLSDFQVTQIEPNLFSIKIILSEGEQRQIFVSTHCSTQD